MFNISMTKLIKIKRKEIIHIHGHGEQLKVFPKPTNVGVIAKVQSKTNDHVVACGMLW